MRLGARTISFCGRGDVLEVSRNIVLDNWQSPSANAWGIDQEPSVHARRRPAPIVSQDDYFDVFVDILDIPESVTYRQS